MNSTKVCFPEAGKIAVREELIFLPAPGEILCAAEKSVISIGTETFACWESLKRAPTGRIGYTIRSSRDIVWRAA